MKQIKSSLTPKLRQNWWIDALLGLSAVVALLSSLYFLAFPVSGYQGGRNPQYDLVVIFSRHTWDILHTWSGVLMIFVAVVHIIIHWAWITATASRTWQVITRKRDDFGLRLTYNILLDVIVALSFLICTVSGIYFLFFPESGPSGQTFLLTKTTWDLIHTWSGVLFTLTAILHFVIHWKWVVNITGKMFRKLRKAPQTAYRSPELEQI